MELDAVDAAHLRALARAAGLSPDEYLSRLMARELASVAETAILGADDEIC